MTIESLDKMEAQEAKATPKLWSLRGVVGTGLNGPMPESEARTLQRLYAYKTAYLVSSTDGITWSREDNPLSRDMAADKEQANG